MNLAAACMGALAGIANFVEGNIFAGILFLISAGIWLKVHYMKTSR